MTANLPSRKTGHTDMWTELPHCTWNSFSPQEIQQEVTTSALLKCKSSPVLHSSSIIPSCTVQKQKTFTLLLYFEAEVGSLLLQKIVISTQVVTIRYHLQCASASTCLKWLTRLKCSVLFQIKSCKRFLKKITSSFCLTQFSSSATRT